MNNSNNNYHQEIPKILDTKFVKYTAVAHALATGLSSGKNVLLHGKGGHAKSEMIEAVLRGLDMWDTAFVSSFGEGTTTDDLWGGINLDAMSKAKGARIEYHPKYSFLNHERAVFEEILDAPSPVLLDLKDTLTRGEFRKNGQKFGMKTKIIIGATNHDPQTYANSDDPADRARVALLERFPIQVAVTWDSYDSSDYLSMYRKHPLFAVCPSAAEKLAEILAEATTQGHFVSPRSAIHALEIVYNNSLDRGHSDVEPSDIADIKCLAGLDAFGEDLIADIEAMSQKADARSAMDKLMTEFNDLNDAHKDAGNSALEMLKISKRAGSLKNRMLDVSVPSDLISLRQEYADRISTLEENAETNGMSLIHE